MTDRALTVSQLNGYVRTALERDPLLQSLTLRAEISKSTFNSSGHWYFTVKDDSCAVDCVMFRSDVARLSFRPRTGDAVLMSGRVSLYPQTGRYQFYCRSMRPDGVGDLYRRFEELKERLAREGLFDQARKRTLPARPHKIAVVTSRTGAVWHDICQVSGGRDPGVPIVLWPCRVQGEGAADEIAQAIRTASALPGVDVLIVGRGGGSMEDLWCFNEEQVVRAIAACPVPVISAVGHETDFTIADFAADVRAATPSHAAELAVPDRSEYENLLRHLDRRLRAAARACVSEQGALLADCRRRLEQQDPGRRIQVQRERLQNWRQRMDAAADSRISSLQPRLHMAEIRLDASVDSLLSQYRGRLEKARSSMEHLSPQRVLERGFAAVTRENGALITSLREARKNSRMNLIFHDGSLRVRQEE